MLIPRGFAVLHILAVLGSIGLVDATVPNNQELGYCWTDSYYCTGLTKYTVIGDRFDNIGLNSSCLSFAGNFATFWRCTSTDCNQGCTAIKLDRYACLDKTNGTRCIRMTPWEGAKGEQEKIAIEGKVVRGKLVATLPLTGGTHAIVAAQKGVLIFEGQQEGHGRIGMVGKGGPRKEARRTASVIKKEDQPDAQQEVLVHATEATDLTSSIHDDPPPPPTAAYELDDKTRAEALAAVESLIASLKAKAARR